jgi:nucleotide-binding universal stress UspA family protein
MQVSHILCPVDFSGLSAHALRYAAMLARRLNASLTVVYAHSFSQPSYFTKGGVEDLERRFRESFHEAEVELEEFTRKQTDYMDVNVRIVEAHPVDAILKAAQDANADLIVMGTHGRSGLNRLMLGSVAEGVLRESKVPVLTVRGDVIEASPSS